MCNISNHFRAYGHEIICSKNHFSKIHHHPSVNISWCIHMNEKWMACLQSETHELIAYTVLTFFFLFIQTNLYPNWKMINHEIYLKILGFKVARYKQVSFQYLISALIKNAISYLIMFNLFSISIFEQWKAIWLSVILQQHDLHD